MKKLQPEVERLRERFAEDKLRQQQEMMALYKREKINPVSGCLPMLIQIDASRFTRCSSSPSRCARRRFSAGSTISRRRITCFINLFGLLPFATPGWLPTFLLIGIWPALMGVTQWLQTVILPAVGAGAHVRIHAAHLHLHARDLPGGAGDLLDLNNLLSTAQQYVMMKRQGVEVHLFNNLKTPSFLRRLGSPNAAPLLRAMVVTDDLGYSSGRGPQASPAQPARHLPIPGNRSSCGSLPEFVAGAATVFRKATCPSRVCRAYSADASISSTR